jgi:hypothetical protein
MTVHARRYGRWCREHFDAVAAEGVPVPREGAAAGAEPETEAEAAPVPEPGSPLAGRPE